MTTCFGLITRRSFCTGNTIHCFVIKATAVIDNFTSDQICLQRVLDVSMPLRNYSLTLWSLFLSFSMYSLKLKKSRATLARLCWWLEERLFQSSAVYLVDLCGVQFCTCTQCPVVSLMVCFQPVVCWNVCTQGPTASRLDSWLAHRRPCHQEQETDRLHQWRTSQHQGIWPVSVSVFTALWLGSNVSFVNNYVGLVVQHICGTISCSSLVKYEASSLTDMSTPCHLFSHSFVARTTRSVWHSCHRHQSPEWTILSHVNCFIQGEVIGFQVLLDSLQSCSTVVSNSSSSWLCIIAFCCVLLLLQQPMHIWNTTLFCVISHKFVGCVLFYESSACNRSVWGGCGSLTRPAY